MTKKILAKDGVPTDVLDGYPRDARNVREPYSRRAQVTLDGEAMHEVSAGDETTSRLAVRPRLPGGPDGCTGYMHVA
jgi:hypothetical protein